MADDYEIGTIVWAKSGKDPSWPSIIFNDDNGLFRRQVGNCSQVYVAFLLKGLRTWVDVSNITHFRLNDRGPCDNPEQVPDSLEYQFDRAVTHANDILSRTAPVHIPVKRAENSVPVIPAEVKRAANSIPTPLKRAALNMPGQAKRPPCYMPQTSRIPPKVNRVANACPIIPQATTINTPSQVPSHGQVKKVPCYMPASTIPGQINQSTSRIPAQFNGTASDIPKQVNRATGQDPIPLQTLSSFPDQVPRRVARVPCYMPVTDIPQVNRQHTVANVHAKDNRSANNIPSQVNISASNIDDKVNISPEEINNIFLKVMNGEISLVGALEDLHMSRSTANRYFSKFKEDLAKRCDTPVSDEAVNDEGHVSGDEISDTDDNSFSPALDFNVNDITHFNHFLCNTNCVHHLVSKIADHSKVCSGSVVLFKEFSLPKGHIGFTSFICLYKCFKCERTIQFSSSPLLDQRPISDYIVLHSKMTSGGEWENVERFTETLGFSSDFTGKFLTEDFQINKYREIISEFAEKSMQEARSKVIVETDQIDTSTDASHENRTNSGNSCVTMISPDTFQVVFKATVSRSEEPVSQCHEKLGTEKICEQVKNLNLKIRANSTDQGSASRQVISNEFPPPLGIEQFDLHHGLKSSRKEIKKCTDGTEANRGITWHDELKNKCGPLVEHLRWAVKECSITVEQYQDPVQLEAAKTKFLARILLPLQHYQNKHERCSPGSRCNRDPEYYPSRRIVTDPVALKLMEKSLTSTVFFKNPERFLLNISTSINESFHNRQIKYLSKKVHLSPEMYRMCIDLAVCDHNENETDIFRGGKRIEPLPLNSDCLPKEPLATRTFVSNIWLAYIRVRITQFCVISD